MCFASDPFLIDRDRALLVLAVPRKGVPPAISQVLTFIARRMVSITKTLAHSVDSLVRVSRRLVKDRVPPPETGSVSGDGRVGADASGIYLSTEMLRHRAAAQYAHTPASHPGRHTAKLTFYHFPAGGAHHRPAEPLLAP